MGLAHSITDVVRAITESPAPVIFLDTCAILDVVRAPGRDEPQNAVISAADALLRKSLTNPPNLWVVLAPQVPVEFSNHLASAKLDTDRRMRETEKWISKLSSAQTLIGLAQTMTLHPSATSSLPESLGALAQGIVDNGLLLDEDPTCRDAALRRYWGGIPPGGRGSEFSDCHIFEHYLRTAQLLRQAGVTSRFVFATANSKDYCDGRNAKPQIEADLRAGDIGFAQHMEWARWYIEGCH